MSGSAVHFDAAAAGNELAAGEAAYRAGDWGTAIAAWNAAREAGADGADLWFNLGNALYRAGQKGRAAAAFEKALRRDPDHADARANLELVRSQTDALVGGAPFLDRVGERISVDTAGAVLLLCWSLACTALIARRFLRGGVARLVFAVVAGVLLVASLGAGVATWSAWNVRHAGWAVVIEPGQLLHAPEPTSEVVGQAHEAMRLRAVGKLGGYARIAMPAGGSAWIDRSRIEPIDP